VGAIEHPRFFLVGQMTREMTVSEIHSEQKEFAPTAASLPSLPLRDVIEIHTPPWLSGAPVSCHTL
jgi:hypothetical protein